MIGTESQIAISLRVAPVAASSAASMGARKRSMPGEEVVKKIIARVTNELLQEYHLLPTMRRLQAVSWAP